MVRRQASVASTSTASLLSASWTLRDEGSRLCSVSFGGGRDWYRYIWKKDEEEYEKKATNEAGEAKNRNCSTESKNNYTNNIRRR